MNLIEAVRSRLGGGEKLVPPGIVEGTRGYVERIVRQANGCYSKGWYDACAVMVRRLIEILIIDSFDAKDKLNDIKEKVDEIMNKLNE